ncbi:baseplate J/gp47 family protein [Chitinophaga sp. Hz27]|uniref:baseplate J/gp47 family protein n=1 Tax=Chitinophaga sp. Hz27 TaxID=3347169 RepID=UPI0035D6FE82
MSTDCSVILNPLFLSRNGTSRKARELAALDPASAPLNGRQLEDDIVYTYRMAAMMRYYNISNQSQGNWQVFFKRDPSTLLALVAAQQSTDFTAAVKQNLQILQEGSLDNSKSLQAKAYYGKIFSGMFSLAVQIDKLYNQLSPTSLLKATIQALISTKLKDQLEKLRQYNAFAATAVPALINNDVALEIIVLGETAQSVNDLATYSFNPIWTSTITPDPNIYGSEPSIVRKLFSATNNTFFKDSLDIFIMGLSKIITTAKQELQQTLSDWDSHEPHNALYLAYLKMLEYTKQQMNGITARHMQLYYQEILRLQPKGPLPNQVYVSFQLARLTDDYLLPQGSLLKAGKFSDNTDAYYATDADIAINNAQINSLQTVFLNPDSTTTGNDVGRVYASPIANSADGNGTAFDNPLTPWHPFANKTMADYTLVQSINMPTATIGFAFASNYLFLREGKRTITITVNLAAGSSFTANEEDFIMEVSTDKGWEQVSSLQVQVTGTPSIVFTGVLTSTQPSTAPWNAAVHQGAYTKSLPVARITLAQNNGKAYIYNTLKDLRMTSYQLDVAVDRVKNIYVQTDAGAMDPTKPFLAFGAAPQAGNTLTIGCDEIFQKNGAVIQPYIFWKDGTTESTFGVPYIYVLHSEYGWYIYNYSTTFMQTAGDTIQLAAENVIAPIFGAGNTPYSPTSVTGYFHYFIFDDLTYQTKIDNRVVYLGKLAAGQTPTQVGNYLPPMVQEIYLSYTASTTSAVTYYHLFPFGENEVTTINNEVMLPSFMHDDNNAISSLAEFYIGITGTTPPRRVNILFQVDESTANPVVAKPDNQVRWHYLSGDTWKDFDNTSVSDGTDDLIRSGIISFALPRDADTAHHVLPDGQYWVKATIHEDDEAICKIIALLPQAVSATLVPATNTSATLPNPLPAGTIAKLDSPQPEIKTITQSFSSFGGFPGESTDDFNLRISELLRHKGRGINIWDYEHLILQQFPQLYRAKCIPHTRFDNSVYNELAPGHVTVITIPKTYGLTGIDPLRPFTYVSDLDAVKKYLSDIISPFVQLHICNPYYEQIKIEASARFFPEYDETMSVQQLQQAITKYLAPWAYEDISALRFETSITNSMIVDLMENQKYVDYVTDVKIYHNGVVTDTVTPDRQSAIIVPVKAEQHVIHIITDNNTGTTTANNDCGCS